MSKTTITKSLITQGNRCTKALYYSVKKPGLREVLSDERKLLLKKSLEVKKIGRDLFPNGVVVPRSNSDFQHAAKLTMDLISQGIETIYDAVFIYDDFAVTVDILVKEDEGWVAYEIKNSVRVNPSYIKELRLTYWVLTKSLPVISDIKILTINAKYIFEENLNLKEFFDVTSVIAQIRFKTMDYVERLSQIKRTLYEDSLPNVAVGQHCFSPFECEFIENCFGKLQEDSILKLSGLPMEIRLQNLKNGINLIGQLEAGHEYPTQLRNRIYASQHKSVVLDQEKINSYLSKIKFPALLFDMEFLNSTVPILQDTHPFEQIPFAFTAFLVKDNFEIIQQKVFVAQPTQKIELELIDELLEFVSACESIVIFDKGMETAWLKRLKRKKKFSTFLTLWNKPIIDLYDPVRKGYFYHYEMHGKYSIKQIHKAIFKTDLYGGKLVMSGLMASYYYQSLFSELDETIVKETIESLKDYSRSDVEALYDFMLYLYKL